MSITKARTVSRLEQTLRNRVRQSEVDEGSRDEARTITVATGSS